MLLLLLAAASGALAGYVCGSVGVLINRMGLNTIVFAVAHGALAGAAMALATGSNPLLTGVGLALLTALILGPLSDALNIPIDMVSMTLFSLYNALTFIFILLSPGTALATERIGEILWGSLLAVTRDYLVILLTLAMIYSIFIGVFWRRLLPIFFDRRLAEAEGLNTKFYSYVLIAVAGVVIAVSLRIVGGFLVFSLLYLPATSSLQLSENIKRIFSASALLGAASAASGVLVSFALDLPTGSSIVICAVAILAGVSVAAHLRRRALLKLEDK